MVLKRTCSHIYVMEKRMHAQVGFSLEARRFVEKKKETCQKARWIQAQGVGFSLAEPRSESGSWDRGETSLLFIIRPTNVRMWHKAVFKVGPVAGAEAHARPARPKIPSAPLAFPFLGAPQAPGNKPNPPEAGKSLGDGPLSPEELSSAETHSAELSRGTTAYRMRPNNWRGKIIHDF